MRKPFKNGEYVRHKTDGMVMEVIRYISQNLVAVKRFDNKSMEVYFNTVDEQMLSKTI